MKKVILATVLLSVMLLNNCGSLKRDDDSNLSGYNVAPAGSRFITSDSMFTVKQNVNPVVTSQPMFKMKRPEDRAMPKIVEAIKKVEGTEWFQDIKRRMPKGYDVNHYKLKPEAKHDETTKIYSDYEETKEINGFVDDINTDELSEDDFYDDSASADTDAPENDDVAVLGISGKTADADIYAVPNSDEVDDEYANMKPEDSYKVVENTKDVDGDLETQMFFDHGSSKIKLADKQKIKTLSDTLKSKKDDYKVSVVGHASKRVDGVNDPARKKAINFQIAKLRASNVKREFSNNGVASDMVLTSSKGDEDAIANPGDLAHEVSDRRVDVYLDNANEYY